MTHFTPSSKLPSDKVFLVGGAVRDVLMGQACRDQDYVVVDLTPGDMLDLGFSQVGKDFPVFLDPDAKEEYALARTERKQGHGYTGFVTQTDGVSLEDDLGRRDLTINAMAMDVNGRVVDPFNGQKDLVNKVLRHVSEAFAEDPLRVLRVARFAARYAQDGFVVAPETMQLMKEMVEAGEVDHLVPERVWLEFTKAAKTATPSVFLRVLHDCGALKRVLPEVDALYGVPQVAEHHPEIDTGVHTEMVLDQAAKLAPGNVRVAFAALTHDLGKAATPADMWPKHHNHEKLGLDPLDVLLERWKVPTDVAQLAKRVCEHHLTCHRALEVRTGTLFDLMEKLDVLRSPVLFDEFLLACEADKRGRLGLEHGDYDQAVLLKMAGDAMKSVSGKQFVEKGLVGLEVKEALRHARLGAIKVAQNEFKQWRDDKASPSKMKM